MGRKAKLAACWVLLFLVVTLLTGCSGAESPGNGEGGLPSKQARQSSGTSAVKEDLLKFSETSGSASARGQDPGKSGLMTGASAFAVYEEMPSDYLPQVVHYQVEPGLGNITNKDMFYLSPEAEKLLTENGFVVVSGDFREFFMLYEMNRYIPIPSFITTDSILHNYHLFFSHLLRVVEKDKLAPELSQLTEQMLSSSQQQYAALKGTGWENAALRNLGFFAVAGQLFNPASPVPEPVEKEVARELELIALAGGIETSPLMNMGQNLAATDVVLEDYSQYIPRGHYAGDVLLEKYFKAMTWYGRMTFRLKSEDETKSAALMTLALREGDHSQKWERIYQPTGFFVGKADDLSYFQYEELLGEIYGSELDLMELAEEGERWHKFLAEAAKLEPPVINSIPIFDEEIQPDREVAIKGFRFMGQRYTLDGEIFQRLIYREVQENSQGHRRMLPQALDIPAALGSSEAYALLKAAGETQYQGYEDNMRQLRDYIGNLELNNWTQNLYWSWLYTLTALLPERQEGYPAFMQNKAWLRKDLNTFLGSWTELKHDTILYAKPAYAEMGGGLDDVDDRGYVEPNPELYARLGALVAMTRDGLSSRGLLDKRDKESLDRMEQLTLFLKTVSEKELTNTPLTDEEYDLIRYYGGELEHFWLEALRDVGVDHRSGIDNNPSALVADVATNPGGQVLQEATGYVDVIYAVVPVDGSLRIARGGVYSHYEFIWPIEERLTNERWREMLQSGEVPPRASWTDVFIAP
jgi:hypothetical protein